MDEGSVERFRQTLFADDQQTSYAIIDGAACEELLPQLSEFAPEYCCLYAGELERDVQECAPYLVQLTDGHPFTEWLLSAGEGTNWSIFLRSPAELRTLRKHFRTFLLVKSPEGQTLYFRYYDPRVLIVYLPTCSPTELRTVFGPVSLYIVRGTSVTQPICFLLEDGVLVYRKFDVP